MSKLYSENDFSDLLDGNLSARIKELSDLKRAVKDAEASNRDVLLKAVVALSYAHWEGYVKFSATKYFDYVARKKLPFSSLEPQFYRNTFLARVNSLSQNKVGLDERIKLIGDIVESKEKYFKYINADLIQTGSNLKFSVLKDICTVCAINGNDFADREEFIDKILLKRRNAIAHGDEAIVAFSEIDHILTEVIAIMREFKNKLENKVYSKGYLVAAL